MRLALASRGAFKLHIWFEEVEAHSWQMDCNALNRCTENRESNYSYFISNFPSKHTLNINPKV